MDAKLNCQTVGVALTYVCFDFAKLNMKCLKKNVGLCVLQFLHAYLSRSCCRLICFRLAELVVAALN
jgi:hypothetical protein